MMESTEPSTPPIWTDKDVRHLLHSLRRPHLLEESRVAQDLAAALGISNPYDAVLATIERTFVNRGFVGKRLRDLIWRCDVDSSLTQAANAAEMGLSSRQFFRYRAEATRAIASQINRVLADKPGQMEPIQALAHLLEDIDPAITLELHALGKTEHAHESYLSARLKAGDRFDDVLAGEGTYSITAATAAAMGKEIHGDRQGSLGILKDVRAHILQSAQPNRVHVEFDTCLVGFVAARHDGDPAKMLGDAIRLREIAGSNEALTLHAVLCEAEAQICSGAPGNGAALLTLIERTGWKRKDVREIGLATLYRAQSLFSNGQDGNAFVLARAALLALARLPYDQFQCRLLVGRIGLQLGMYFQVPYAHDFGPRSWSGAYEIALKARAAIGAADMTPAREFANAAAQAAQAYGYNGVAAWNEATLAALAFSENVLERAQYHAIEAWMGLARTGDRLLARDLFCCPGLRRRDIGPLLYDAAFSEAMKTMLCERFPLFPVVSNFDAREIFCEFLQTIALDAARSSAPSSSGTKEALGCAATLVGESGCGAQIERTQDEFIETICFLLAATLPQEARSAFSDAIGTALRSFLNKVRAALAPWL